MREFFCRKRSVVAGHVNIFLFHDLLIEIGDNRLSIQGTRTD